MSLLFRRSIPLLTLGLVLAFAAACGGDSKNSPGSEVGDGLSGTEDAFNSDDGKLNVATTVAPITSIVLNVGGDRIHIHGIVPAGVDSHTFEPKPSDAKTLSRADLLIMNGADLEGSTEKIASDNLKDPSKIYKLADNTLSDDSATDGFLYDFSFPRADGHPNPHLWMNPLYAMKYADLVRGWLSENDPANAEYFQANYDRFAKVLTALDAAIRADQSSVPEANRRLLTYHDSWAYWAREYGWEVVGAIQPSDFKEPSARELADLITQLKELKLPAIFGSEVFPSKTLDQIAKESGAVYEDRLRDDEPPGEVNDPAYTYVGMVAEDMRIMFSRLGGNADNVAAIEVANSFVR